MFPAFARSRTVSKSLNSSMPRQRCARTIALTMVLSMRAGDGFQGVTSAGVTTCFRPPCRRSEIGILTTIVRPSTLSFGRPNCPAVPTRSWSERLEAIRSSWPRPPISAVSLSQRGSRTHYQCMRRRDWERGRRARHRSCRRSPRWFPSGSSASRSWSMTTMRDALTQTHLQNGWTDAVLTFGSCYPNRLGF